MNILAGIVSELYGCPGFVRDLVLGEAGVSVYPEDRASVLSRIRNEVWADLLQPGAEIDDESCEGIPNLSLEALLVRIEPLAVVVPLELAQEGHQLWSEMGLFGHFSPVGRGAV